MLLQATLNGSYSKAQHGAIPVTLEELAEDAAACSSAGARSFHVHPRDLTGAESLDAAVVDSVVAAVKRHQPCPVGVSTGAWIEPVPRRRLSRIANWTRPDFASVNLGEDGALDIIRALLATPIGIEAAVWSVEDAELLVHSGLGPRMLRVMVEPIGVGLSDALPLVDAIHAVLDRGGVTVPRLQHGEGEATWALLQDAVRRGIDTRIGFEDTFHLPDGKIAGSNTELVRAAREFGAGTA